jgi:hypothetical protein
MDGPAGAEDSLQVVNLVGDDPGEGALHLQDMPDPGRVLEGHLQGPGTLDHAADPGKGEAGLEPLRYRFRFRCDPWIHEDEGPSPLLLNNREPEGYPCLGSRDPGGPVVAQGIQEIGRPALEGGGEIRDLPGRSAKDIRRAVGVPGPDLKEGEDSHVDGSGDLPGLKKGI